MKKGEKRVDDSPNGGEEDRGMKKVRRKESDGVGGIWSSTEKSKG